MAFSPITLCVAVCASYVAAGLWLAAITLHDVLEAVSLFGDLQRKNHTQLTIEVNHKNTSTKDFVNKVTSYL